MKQVTTRFIIIDQIRGFAVFLMIFFHLFYDLDMFNIVQNDFINNKFWYGLPRLIVALFLGTVGISVTLAHPNEIRRKKALNRFFQVSLLALIISISTYTLYPERWIYFGTLHCIALCGLVALPFRKFPITSLIIGLGLFIPETVFNYRLPWILFDQASMDYIAFLPWFGATLVGIFLHSVKLHTVNFFKHTIFTPFTFLGKHALIIYLIHQPILVGVTWSIYTLQKYFQP